MGVIYPTLYEGLRAGWLVVDDLGPLAGVQVWLRLAGSSGRHDGASARCRNFAVHEFGCEGTDSLFRLCDPDGPPPR